VEVEEQDKDRNLVFSPKYGVSLPFGLGIRAYFGAKLAIKSTRIQVLFTHASSKLKYG
jgi:hypothetical protein